MDLYSFIFKPNRSGYFVFPVIKKKKKHVWVGIDGEDMLGRREFRWWGNEDVGGGWLLTVSCDREVHRWGNEF